MIKRLRIVFQCLLLFALLSIIPESQVYAAEASAVSFGTIDYENLTLQVYNHNNNVIYYSTDNSTWSEIEGGYNSTTKTYSMDISWVSESSEVTLYFKGDIVKTVKPITLPMQNASIVVEYDKVEGEFTFGEVEEADSFEWRKFTDYQWNTVSFMENSVSYQKFLITMENLRTKGAKLLIRTPQEIGTGVSKVGMRPSAEVTITIPARVAAPNVKVNAAKLTINTTSSIEYYDAANDLWMECDGAMLIEDIAPKVLFENGGSAVTLLLRKAATTSASHSKIQKLIIPGQAAAPTIGGNNSEVTYYFLNSKLVMQMNKASTTNIYEYLIVKDEDSFDLTRAVWKTVNSNKIMTISSSIAPSGSTIYVRKKGIEENLAKNSLVVLPSAAKSFTLSY